MFKVGDKLKTNMAVAEAYYSQWKGSQVYTNYMTAAETKRFEVVADDGGSNYQIKRDDGEVLLSPKAEAHAQFIVAND